MADSPIQPGDFDEELLSGYLDGELSSEEQDQVERLVQQDPQAQRLLEDLEQIRHCLQELPAKQPAAEARQRVLDTINSENLAENGGLQRPAVLRTPPTTAIISWLVAAAAGIALLFIVPPLLQDSTQVAQKRGDVTGSSGPEESDESPRPSPDPAGSEGTEEEDAFSGMMDAESQEYSSEQIPVVYVTVPADAVDQIPAILATNNIRFVDSSVVNERLRANKRYEDNFDLAEKVRRLVSDEEDAAPGAGFGATSRSLDDRSTVARPADNQRQQAARYVQHSTMIVEGSPEELEIAWKQINQHKNIQLVQQAGPQLKGLKYDANAYRDQSLATTGPPTEKAAGKPFAEDAPLAGEVAGRGRKAPDGDSLLKLAQRLDSRDAEGADKKNVFADRTVTKKSGNESNPIIIQLIIQVAE